MIINKSNLLLLMLLWATICTSTGCKKFISKESKKNTAETVIERTVNEASAFIGEAFIKEMDPKGQNVFVSFSAKINYDNGLKDVTNSSDVVGVGVVLPSEKCSNNELSFENFGVISEGVLKITKLTIDKDVKLCIKIKYFSLSSIAETPTISFVKEKTAAMIPIAPVAVIKPFEFSIDVNTMGLDQSEGRAILRPNSIFGATVTALTSKMDVGELKLILTTNKPESICAKEVFSAEVVSQESILISAEGIVPGEYYACATFKNSEISKTIWYNQPLLILQNFSGPGPIIADKTA